jgi:hypothetical protein
MSISWDDIPAAERFELLATIREVREWRYGGVEPLRPLQPITQAALALYEFRLRSGERTGVAGGRPQVGRFVTPVEEQSSQRRAIRGARRTPDGGPAAQRALGGLRPVHLGVPPTPKPQGELFHDASAN